MLKKSSNFQTCTEQFLKAMSEKNYMNGHRGSRAIKVTWRVMIRHMRRWRRSSWSVVVVPRRRRNWSWERQPWRCCRWAPDEGHVFYHVVAEPGVLVLVDLLDQESVTVQHRRHLTEAFVERFPHRRVAVVFGCGRAAGGVSVHRRFGSGIKGGNEHPLRGKTLGWRKCGI